MTKRIVDFELVEKFLCKFGSQSLLVPIKDRNKSETEIPLPARTVASSKASASKVFELNSDGDYGLFFGVNQSNSATLRQDDNIVMARAIYIDDDQTGSRRTDFPIPPNIVVNTSPGKYHYYWLTSTDDMELYQRVQQCLVDDWNGDPNARDNARILRIPGTYHLKNDPCVVTAEFIIDDPYPWEVILEAFPPADVVRKINHSASGEFDKDSAKDKIIDQSNYHETLRDLTMSWANKGLDREDVADLARMQMLKVPKSARDARWESRIEDQHIYECVDSALRKIASEQSESLEHSVAPTQKEQAANKAPPFPENVFEGWPEPWPMIWDSFRGASLMPVDALLAPTMISAMGYILRGKYRTEQGRRPHFMFLNLCRSTGSKDTNSRNVLRSFSQAMGGGGTGTQIAVNPFQEMLGFTQNVSADTSFVEAFDENGNQYLMNTEGTRVYQQIGTNQHNSSVMGLSDKFIESCDGFEISGKVKSGNKIPSIYNPNVQIIFYAQPETIEKYLTESMVQSGLFGRSNIAIVEDLEIDKQTYGRFTLAAKNSEPPEEFLQFISQAMGNIINWKGSKDLDPVNCKLTDDQKIQSEKWWRGTKLFDQQFESDDLFIVLDRHAMFTEQLYAIVLGVCQVHDEICNLIPRPEIDVSLLYPLIEYWQECKVYAMRNFINTSNDPLFDTVVDLINEFRAGTKKPNNDKDAIIIANDGVVPSAQIVRAINNKKKLRDQLNLGTGAALSQRVQTTLRAMVDAQILIELKIGAKKCYTVAK